jgi:uncharacterized protein YukE
MMVANIIMDKATIQATLKALQNEMGRINSASLICGIRTAEMKKNYKSCEQAYDALAKGLENISAAETMVKEKK